MIINVELKVLNVCQSYIFLIISLTSTSELACQTAYFEISYRDNTGSNNQIPTLKLARVLLQDQI